MMLKTATIAGAATLLAFSAHAAELTEERVGELVEQFLRDNPKVIIESLQSFQLQEEAERVKRQQEAVKEMKSHFERDDHHYGEAGNPDGDVLIVEFFDYNCPACKMMFESIDALLQEDTNVRVIFIEYPIFGPTSDENAKIAMAVNTLEPEKYFKFHQAIMRQKGKVDSEFLLQTAEGLGIDREELKEEAAKEKYMTYIQEDRALGRKLQVSGTPALIVGDKMANGALDLQALKNHVRWAREDLEAQE